MCSRCFNKHFLTGYRLQFNGDFVQFILFSVQKNARKQFERHTNEKKQCTRNLKHLLKKTPKKCCCEIFSHATFAVSWIEIADWLLTCFLEERHIRNTTQIFQESKLRMLYGYYLTSLRTKSTIYRLQLLYVMCKQFIGEMLVGSWVTKGADSQERTDGKPRCLKIEGLWKNPKTVKREL